MVAKKPKVVIVGAGMAGLTAAHKLYTTPSSRELFELSVVEGGNRTGGRINTSEFCGDKIEMGATWIHGIVGSPVHKIAEEIGSLQSQQPWECMDGFSDEKMKVAETIAEGGLVVNPSIVEPISSLFDKLMETAQCKLVDEDDGMQNNDNNSNDNGEGALCAQIPRKQQQQRQQLSVGSFLRQGLRAYWESRKKGYQENGDGTVSCDWDVKLLEEATFSMFENTQRTYTGAGDLYNLDFAAESEYRMYPGEEITIPRGYSSVVESLASTLPDGLIRLGKKVVRIEWLSGGGSSSGRDGGGLEGSNNCENNVDGIGGNVFPPVKLHFSDGSMMVADHVIVTVSLGVLKAGIEEGPSGLFSPPLPEFKTDAISKLGFGVVNKLFLQSFSATESKDGNNYHHRNNQNNKHSKFPYIQMLFHRLESECRHQKIPWWMRRTASLYPIYSSSSVLLCWFAGKEALELERLEDEEIIDGVSRTVSCFSSSPCNQQQKQQHPVNSADHDDHYQLYCNGKAECCLKMRFTKLLKSKWGTDPLFLGSYSYVAVGSSGDDLDTMAEPLPSSSAKKENVCDDDGSSMTNANCTTAPPLQILFAGEATHRIHYSTTHGAFLSGLREAKRLLQHYCVEGLQN